MRQAHAKLAEDSSSGEEQPVWCGDSVSLTADSQSSVVEVEIQHNCHGAALLSIAQASDQGYIGEHGRHQALGRLANGLLLFLLSSGIQFVLISLLFFFSEERMQDPYEDIATATAAQELYQAISANEALPKTQDAVKLCLQDHSLPWSQSMVCFVWLCKCVPSLVNAVWGTIVLVALPNGHRSCAICMKAGKLNVVALPTVPKIAAVILIQLPLVLLHLSLALVGLKFLMYCNALGKLLVKAMSLAYIETVSAVLFAGLSSKAFQLEVNKSFLVKDFQKLVVFHLEPWLSGFMKVFSVGAMIFWYCRIYHYNLSEFRLACYEYKYQFIFPNCGRCGLDFFGFHLAN